MRGKVESKVNPLLKIHVESTAPIVLLYRSRPTSSTITMAPSWQFATQMVMSSSINATTNISIELHPSERIPFNTQR